MTRTGAAPIRILIVDDHPLILAGLEKFLAVTPELQVVDKAGNGEEALEKYRKLLPEIVLMDLRMPVMDGLAATRAILEEFPEAGIIVLTTYDGDEDIYRALDAGAKGYLVKDSIDADVLNVIRAVLGGRRGIPPVVAATLAEHTPRVPLTPRETEVLSLITQGCTNADIAERIGRTEETVKVHVKNILRKLDVHHRTDAVTTALRRGFVHLE